MQLAAVHKLLTVLLLTQLCVDHVANPVMLLHAVHKLAAVDPVAAVVFPAGHAVHVLVFPYFTFVAKEYEPFAHAPVVVVFAVVKYFPATTFI